MNYYNNPLNPLTLLLIYNYKKYIIYLLAIDYINHKNYFILTITKIVNYNYRLISALLRKKIICYYAEL